MKTTARQFFHIWAECTRAVRWIKVVPGAEMFFRDNVLARIRERHGPEIAIEAECYFERLKADTQAGISSL